MKTYGLINLSGNFLNLNVGVGSMLSTPTETVTHRHTHPDAQQDPSKVMRESSVSRRYKIFCEVKIKRIRITTYIIVIVIIRQIKK